MSDKIVKYDSRDWIPRGKLKCILSAARLFFLPLRNNGLQECQGRIIGPGVGNVLVTVFRAQRIGEENETRESAWAFSGL